MLAAGIVVTWFGYAVTSWGYCLIRGYNVTFRQWVSPLNPYQWPQGGPEKIPDTQLLPKGTIGQYGPSANPFG